MQENKLLSAACADGEWEEAQTLIDEHSGLFYVDRIQRSVLHIALQSEPPYDLVYNLLQKGVCPFQKNAWGGTALHVAASFPIDPRIVKLLIDAGCDVNGEDFQGETPVMLSAWQSHPNLEAMKMLLDASGDPNKVNASNESAMIIVAKEPKAKTNRRSLMCLLLRYGGSITDEVLQCARKAGNSKIIADMLIIRIMTIVASPRVVSRIRGNQSYVHALPTDLTRQLRLTLYGF
jgi:ankyrin repeat protein